MDRDEIVLLGGGNKSTPNSDIRMAKDCWKEYNAEADE
jgi:putative component of toxin-antitoxin plasmid stabilization module